MKKFLAIILALTLVLSMSVTAFAENSNSKEQVVSVTVPDYKYTVTFPSDCSITYGNTGNQKVGEVSVSSTMWSTFNNNKKHVRVYVSGDGVLTNENGKTLPCEFGYAEPPENRLIGNDWWATPRDFTMDYFVKVSNWSSAEPGTTYSTIITYTATVGDEIN